jgi:hypothetical protein
MAWCKNLTVSAAEIGRYHLRLQNVLSQTTLERDARFRRCSPREVRNGATFDVERPEKVPIPNGFGAANGSQFQPAFLGIIFHKFATLTCKTAKLLTIYSLILLT